MAPKGYMLYHHPFERYKIELIIPYKGETLVKIET